MTILILGGGLMGPAAAWNALNDPQVATVGIADRDPEQLDESRRQLERHPRSEHLRLHTVDLDNTEAAQALFAGYDVAMAALPWSASVKAFDAAIATRTPIVDLAIPDDDALPELARRAQEAGALILLGCGLEPGLTEIIARYNAKRLDAVEELHIKCGGVPEQPQGPLGYRIVFGGRSLPLRSIPTRVVHDGAVLYPQRYSEVEHTEFAGLAPLEAWNEGLFGWLLEMDEFRDIREGTQKTLRWPGYAARATVLNELGLLATDPVDVGGTAVVPKQVVDTVLWPHVRLRENEVDLTLFRVDLIGVRGGHRVRVRTDMVDRRDPQTGFTSMARTTSFTGAIAARMIGSGEIGGVGLYTAEQLIADSAVETMLRELAVEGVTFETTESEA